MKIPGAIVAAAVAFAAANVSAQLATNSPPARSLPGPATNEWSFYASVYAYFVPDSRDYVNPNFTADRGWLHLEARYNYEALQTASLWAGYNFSFGRKLVLDVTPMVGGVFGDITGVAPGYNLTLTYRWFTLSSQSEYVFDTGNSSNDFAYTWSELSYAPVEWFRVGAAVQRTRLYHTSLDVQRGFLVGFQYKKLDFTAYVFNLGWTDPTIVLEAGLSF